MRHGGVKMAKGVLGEQGLGGCSNLGLRRDTTSVHRAIGQLEEREPVRTSIRISEHYTIVLTVYCA